MNAFNSKYSTSCDLITNLPISELRRNIANKNFTSTEVTKAFLDEMRRKRHLNVFITELTESSVKQAKKSDERIARGKPLPLDGIPIAVKDNYCTKGTLTTAGSKILSNFIPTYESFITQKLKAAGAIVLGKTNMDEFAMGSSTESSYFGPTINPIGKAIGLDNLVPGGSSGGSAAAVAGGLAAAALGTDTGGSVRQPASFCGVVGFKPSYGVCSRWGIIAYGSSLDQAGVLCKSVEDVSIIMDVIAGEDKRDTTSCANKEINFIASLKQEPKKIKIGIAKEIIEAGSTEDTEKIWHNITKIAEFMKAELIEVSLPSFKYSLPAYYIIALSEASSNLARYDGVRYGFRAENYTDITDMYEKTRAEGFGAEVKRRIMLGTYALSAGYYEAYYLKALKVRNKITQELNIAFSEVDALMMPTTPGGAFEIGAYKENPVEMYLGDLYTVPVNLAGLPAISIPVAKNFRGLPLSLQIVGKQFDDEKILRIGSTVEVASAFLDLN